MKLRTDDFQHRLADARAQWSKDGHTVLRYGDPINEYWAVRDGGLGLIDRSERETIVIHGDDTIPWLQGLITADLMTLQQEGSGLRSSIVNQVGKAICDMRILHMPEMLICDVEPGNLKSNDIMHHLGRHIIMENVKVLDRTPHTTRLTVTGEHSAELLDKVGRFDRKVASIKTMYYGTWGQIAGCDVVIQRIELTGELTFDISCSRDDAATVWSACFEGSDQVRLVGSEALKMLRMEAGVVAFNGEEYHNKIIPIEANLNDTISYDKGCYLGQEVIHRLDTRGKPAKMLRALVPASSATTHTLAIGQKCTLEGKKVGDVVSISRSPLRDDVEFGWAYLKRNAYDSGKTVTIEDVEYSVVEPSNLVDLSH